MSTILTPRQTSDSSQRDLQVAAAPATDVAPGKLRAVRRKQRFERAHLIVSRVLLGAILLQVFFAGLGIFTTTGFLPHAIWGATVILASFSLPILALAGHLERSILRRSLLLAGLMVVQGLLIDISRVAPVVGALHPVNAMLLVLVTYGLAQRR